MNDKAIIAALNDLAVQVVTLTESVKRIEGILAEAEKLLAKLKLSPGGAIVVKIDQQ